MKSLKQLNIFTSSMMMVALLLMNSEKTQAAMPFLGEGGSAGNGGLGMECDDGRLMFYDYWEASSPQKYGWKLDFGPPGLTVKEKVQHVFSRIKDLNPSRYELYMKWLGDFFENRKQHVDEEYGTTLPLQADLHRASFPDGCKPVQVIIQTHEPLPGQRRYLVDQDFLERMEGVYHEKNNTLDPEEAKNQVANAYSHEIILRDFSKMYGHKENSQYARFYNGILSSSLFLANYVYTKNLEWDQLYVEVDGKSEFRTGVDVAAVKAEHHHLRAYFEMLEDLKVEWADDHLGVHPVRVYPEKENHWKFFDQNTLSHAFRVDGPLATRIGIKNFDLLKGKNLSIVRESDHSSSFLYFVSYWSEGGIRSASSHPSWSVGSRIASFFPGVLFPEDKNYFFFNRVLFDQDGNLRAVILNPHSSDYRIQFLSPFIENLRPQFLAWIFDSEENLKSLYFKNWEWIDDSVNVKMENGWTKLPQRPDLMRVDFAPGEMRISSMEVILNEELIIPPKVKQRQLSGKVSEVWPDNYLEMIDLNIEAIYSEEK